MRLSILLHLHWTCQTWPIFLIHLQLTGLHSQFTTLRGIYFTIHQHSKRTLASLKVCYLKSWYTKVPITIVKWLLFPPTELIWWYSLRLYWHVPIWSIQMVASHLFKPSEWLLLFMVPKLLPSAVTVQGFIKQNQNTFINVFKIQQV